MLIEEHSHWFMHYFGVKTLSETPCSPPLKQPGYGARQEALAQAGWEPEEAADRLHAVRGAEAEWCTMVYMCSVLTQAKGRLGRAH